MEKVSLTYQSNKKETYKKKYIEMSKNNDYATGKILNFASFKKNFID